MKEVVKVAIHHDRIFINEALRLVVESFVDSSMDDNDEAFAVIVVRLNVVSFIKIVAISVVDTWSVSIDV